MPAAEFRDATVTAWVASRSSGVFCSIWNHAVRPPPRASLPRTPKFDDGACTSNFDIAGTQDAAASPRANAEAGAGPLHKNLDMRGKRGRGRPSRATSAETVAIFHVAKRGI